MPTTIIKSEYYLQNVERPLLVKYFLKLAQSQPQLDWDKLSLSMKSQNEVGLGELYDTGELKALYKTVLGVIQSVKARTGRELELKTQRAFEELVLSFGYQVPVKNNIVIAKREKGCNIIDFVHPKPNLGDSLCDFIIFSTKSTLRERKNQDLHLECKYICFITHDAQLDASENNIIKIPRQDTDFEQEKMQLKSEIQRVLHEIKSKPSGHTESYCEVSQVSSSTDESEIGIN